MNYFKTVTATLTMLLVWVYPAKSQHVQKPNTQTYSYGITLFKSGLYEKSAQELKVFIKQHPNHKLVQSARFYQSRALAKADPPNAGAYFSDFIEEYPNTVFAQKLLLDYANNEKQAGNYKNALDFYHRVLRLSINKKQAAKVYYWMAQAEAKRNNYDQARKYYLTVADKYPKSDLATKALFERGRLFLKQKNYEASSKAFQILENRYPNDKMTRQIGTALGESYYQQHKYKQAIQSLNKGLPYLKGEGKDKAIFLIAESYNALNNFDKASTSYLRYINLTKDTPKERPAHYGLGWVYNKQKIYHWASREFGKAAQGQDTLARKALYYKAINQKLGGQYNQSLQSFEKFGKKYSSGLWVDHAYYEWAITAYEVGKYGEAIEALLPLVRSGKKFENEGKIYTRLGQAYFANKEYTRALQAFKAAENLTNIDPKVKRQARFQKGWVQYRNQAYKASQKTFADVYKEAPDSKTGKKALFWDADSYYNLKQYSEAGGLFRRFINENPDSKLTGAARYSLGWSYFKRGAYAKAIPPFQNFLQHYNPPKIALFPYDTDTRLRLGDSYYAQSDYNKAIEVYQQSVGDDPGGDYALFQIGNCYYRSDRTYEAVKTFRRFLQKFPQSNLKEQAQYTIAYVYLNTQNYEQAIKEFRTAIQKYPGTQWAARSQYNIGDAYYNDGKYDKAAAAYKKVLNKYPNSDYVVEAANGIEYAQQASNGGKPADSTSALDTYLKNNGKNTSKNDELRYQQAESLVQSGDYIKAIKKLKQYIRISNNDRLLPKAYINLGKSYERTNRGAMAADAYQSVVNNYSNSGQLPEALAALGRLMYAQQNYRQSLNNYKQLEKQGGRHKAEAEVGMGNAQVAMGNTGAAKKNYQAALSSGGSADAAKLGLANIDIQQSKFAEAATTLQPIAQKNTGETGAEAQYLLGMVKQKQGQYKNALDAYAKVKVLYKAYDQWVAKAMLNSGESYMKLGNTSEARKELQSLIRQFPQRPEAGQARQKLRSMK